jgi:proline-specific peptidase
LLIASVYVVFLSARVRWCRPQIWDNPVKVAEGYIPLKSGYRIWYRRIGDCRGVPLLVIHGGPGSGHDYLEPLERLSKRREIIFYDQLGCGNSDRPADCSLWRMERFLAELDEVREALHLRRVNVLGQSWGGMLAIEYAVSKPQGIHSLILADTCASMPQLVKEIKCLRSQLPPETIAVLDHYEAAGDFHHPDYRAAVEHFYKRHVYRLSTIPACLLLTAANLKNSRVYETMNGPNELVITGNLKEWDRTDQLSQITVPTLVLVGRHDEVTPACAETIHHGINGSQLVVFRQSAHLPHLEEEERYLHVVDRFLTQVDALPYV